MTEKELLYQITHTSLAQLVKTNPVEEAGIIPFSDEHKEMNQKLISYLIEKSELGDLLSTIIEGDGEEFNAPDNFTAYITRYDNSYLRPTTNGGRTIEPHRSGRFDGTTIMDTEQYLNDRLETLLPQMIEAYPLAFITAVNKTKVAERPEVTNAIAKYIDERYIAPLVAVMPEISVKYTIKDKVEFIIDDSKLNDIEKSSLAKGDYISYKITLKG